MIDKRETIMKAHGKALADIRIEYGYTQEEIAKHLDICVNTYASYERGEHDIPFEVTQTLALFYKTTLNKLITR